MKKAAVLMLAVMVGLFLAAKAIAAEKATKDKGDPGKLLFKEFGELAKAKGEGWVDYMWINPGDPKPRKKITYVYRVPGKDMYVGAGIYEKQILERTRCRRRAR